MRGVRPMCVMFLTYLCVCSVKPVVEKAPLVIPLIQQNRWHSARKPEDLETDDDVNREKKAVKVVDVQQTGDKETDAAVREILGGKCSVFSLLNVWKFYFYCVIFTVICSKFSGIMLAQSVIYFLCYLFH